MKLGRPITSGISIDPLLTHWICKDCEVMNATNRSYCLSCDKPRTLVQIKDHEKIKALRNSWGYVHSGVGKRSIKPIKIKPDFNNGEYP